MNIVALSAALIGGSLFFGSNTLPANVQLITKTESYTVKSTVAIPAITVRKSTPIKATSLPVAPAVPVIPELKVTVNAGDYLTKIASKYNSDTLRVFYANTDIQNPDLIYPGQELRIPRTDEQLTPRDIPVSTQISANQATAAQAMSGTSTRSQPVTSYAANPSSSNVWESIAACESGGNWSINTGNGFYGGLQFTVGSWQAVGGAGLPSDASKDEQIARGQALQARQGWGAWPVCSAKAGV